MYFLKNHNFDFFLNIQISFLIFIPLICIDDDFLGGRVMDEQSGPQSVPGVVNSVLPLREPQTLEGHERGGQLVVDPYNPAKVSQLVDRLVVAENLHRVFDAF